MKDGLISLGSSNLISGRGIILANHGEHLDIHPISVARADYGSKERWITSQQREGKLDTNPTPNCPAGVV